MQGKGKGIGGTIKNPGTNATKDVSCAAFVGNIPS